MLAPSTAPAAMGVPPVLPLPAAASAQAGCPPHQPRGHMLLWTALLLLGESGSRPEGGTGLVPPRSVGRSGAVLGEAGLA